MIVIVFVVFKSLRPLEFLSLEILSLSIFDKVRDLDSVTCSYCYLKSDKSWESVDSSCSMRGSVGLYGILTDLLILSIANIPC